MRVRLMVLLAALAGVAAFVVPAKDGRPLLDFRGVKAKLLRAAPVAAGGAEGGGVYKWKGDDGTWHYGNVPPEGREGVEKVEETVTWAKGPGGSAGPAAAGADPERPRSAAELLAESKRLREQSEGRRTELRKMMDEANR